MEFGDFEISEWTIFIICMVIFFSILTIWGYKLDIEKEKTKQVQYQYNMIIEERGNINGTNN